MNVAERLERCGFPARHLDLTLDDLDAKAQARVRSYWDWMVARAPIENHRERGLSLYFYGDFGYGKSAAATVIAGLFASHGASVQFVRALELNRYFRDGDFEFMDKYLLVIDDFGAKEDKDFGRTRDYLENVIRRRYDAGLPVIITTNINKPTEAFPEVSSIFKETYGVFRFEETNWRAKRSVEHPFNAKRKG